MDTPQLAIQPSDEGHRIVTVLIAKVTGLSQLADYLELSAARNLVKQTWERLDQIIHEYEGWIAGHLGDLIISVWGYPASTENNPEMVVKAGLAIREAILTQNPVVNNGIEQLKLQIAIHTGTLLLVNLTQNDQVNLVGEAITTGLHIVQTIEPGKVVISENCYRLVRGACLTSQLSPISVPGLHEPLMLYQVDDDRTVSGRVRYGSVNAMQTNMVGRQAELAQLQEYYQQAIRQPRPTLVVVTGEPGSGKSRLLMEFGGSLEADIQSFYLMSARALVQTVRVPFYLWKMLLYNRFGLTIESSTQTACDKFLREFQWAWGRQLGPVPAIEAVHMVGSIVGLDWSGSQYLARYSQDPVGRVNRAFDIVRELLFRIVSTRPTLLMFDDIHWADEDSLDLITSLLETSESTQDQLPLMILLAARPQFLEQQSNLARFAQVIKLEDLNPTTSTITTAYPGLQTFPDQMLDSLAKYSAGNPYILEEIVRRLFSSGETVTEAGLYKTLVHLNSQPSASLEAILRTRLEDLPRVARATALLASIPGRVFWVGAIEAAARAYAGKQTDVLLTLPLSLTEQSIREGLDQLVKAEIVFPRANSNYSSEQEYIFKHDILRDVAFSMIPAVFHSSYHKAVGRWMLSRGEPEFMIMAADQYEMAGYFAEAQGVCAQVAQNYLSRGAIGESQMLLERSRMIRDRSSSDRISKSGY
jgi:class 3 adenylate cyclase